MISEKRRFLSGLGILWKTFLFLVISAFIGKSCSPPDQGVAYPNGDPTGTFYSSAVLHRFESGLSPEKARGKKWYLQYCAICHGETGDGKGFNAYNLKSSFGVQPFDFTDSAAVAKIPMDEFRQAITYGGTAVNRSQYMPPWGGVLTEEEVYDLTAFIQTFAMRDSGAK